jgi:hypothetical protein
MLQQQDWREVRRRVGGHERPVSAAMQEKEVASWELLECALVVLEVSSLASQANRARVKVRAILRSRLDGTVVLLRNMKVGGGEERKHMSKTGVSTR